MLQKSCYFSLFFVLIKIITAYADHYSEEFEKKMVEYNLSFMVLGILISFVTCALTFKKEFLARKFNYFCVLHILSFNSTSFIEEEYLTMYYIGSTVILLKIMNSHKDWKSGFIALFILRVAQTLNQVKTSKTLKSAKTRLRINFNA